MGAVAILQFMLASTGIAFGAHWWRIWQSTEPSPGAVPLASVLIGGVTCFLDALGIGSFATTTALLRWKKLIRDDLLPGTLNVGIAIPTVAQALIYIVLIEVDYSLLIACTMFATLGAWYGGGIVASLNVNTIRIVMGLALVVFAGLFVASGLGYFPVGGQAISLPLLPFIVAVGVFFILGVLMSAGIGLYAPALVVLSLMGMDPKAIFPIMMSACAFLMPATGVRFLQKEKVSLPIALGLTLLGTVAVPVAAYIVKEIPLELLRWLVVVVVLYAAISLLRDGFSSSDTQPVQA